MMHFFLFVFSDLHYVKESRKKWKVDKMIIYKEIVLSLPFTRQNLESSLSFKPWFDKSYFCAQSLVDKRDW